MFGTVAKYMRWTILINIILPINAFTYKCIHDKITSKNESLYWNYKAVRIKRSALFEPLKIFVHMSNIDARLSKDVTLNIKVALERAKDFLFDTIQVKEAFSPFVLDRTSCSQKWRQGQNKGKCSKLKSNPEFCSTAETDFVIPDRYLNEIKVYNINDSDPIYSIERGHGAENSNFILFVISKSTSWCHKNDVQAYGSYCRLDKTNRPVAGLLNICPENFSKKLFKPDHYFNIIMHELFHILGFSKFLYSKFQSCNSIHECELPKQIVSRDKNGINRIIFPEVVKSMQIHFNCSDPEFGGPLEKSLDMSSNEYTSHWHPLLMYSSIMTPAIQQEDYVVIDNITLALLASSGWYKIDFRKAQDFIFGQGENCNFGENCSQSNYLCVPSNNTGCDISHQTIGKCEAVTSDHSCGVYKPNKEESCMEEDGKLYGLDWDTLGYERRCIFLPKVNDSFAAATCVILNCQSSSSLNIFHDGKWIDCADTNQVSIGNITVNCPSPYSFCLSKGLAISESACGNSKDDFALDIELYFESPTFKEISNNLDNFKIRTIEHIANLIEIPTSYIVNSTLTVYKKLHLSFVICPPPDIERAKLNSLILNTQQFLKKSLYTDIFQAYKDLPVASTKIRIDFEQAIGFSDYEGFKALIVVPIFCIIFIFATIIASAIRRISMQKYRPKRGMEESTQMQTVTLVFLMKISNSKQYYCIYL